MEQTELALGYAEWIITVALTIGIFNYFSKKFKKLASLVGTVLPLTWIILSFTRGLKYIYLHDNYELFSLRGFSMLMAEMLPILLLFGGITFAVKYLKFRKKKA